MRFLYGVLFMILIDSWGILTVDDIVAFALPELNYIFGKLFQLTS